MIKPIVSVLISSLVATSTVISQPNPIEYSPRPSIIAQEASSTPEAIFAEVWGKNASTGLIIADCESDRTQFNEDGSVLHGKIDKDDIGILQINLRYHKDTAEKLGYDVSLIRDNISYGYHLFTTSGLMPWSASRKCLKEHGLEV